MADNTQMVDNKVLSSNSSGNNNEESYTDKELLALLDGYNPKTTNDETDIVDNRYSIDVNTPLPEFDRFLTKAFKATDNLGEYGDIYALVTSNLMPFRSKAIAAFQKITHPAIAKCYAAKPIYVSIFGERRLVLIVQRPKGRKLSDIVAEQGALPDRFAIENILRPLCEVIDKLHQEQINHGCINPDNIYYDQNIMLCEAISEPSGYSQLYAYEPPERLLTAPYGKGSGDLVADTYALGILTIFLCNGKLHQNASLPPQELQKMLLRNGCYNTHMKNITFADNLLDILRGTLNDNPLERWTTKQLSSCLAGKRYNLIPPSIPRDSTRTFTYLGENFSSQRALANALANSWQEAKTELDVPQLIRWLELSTNDTGTAEAIESVLHNANEKPDAVIKDIELAKAIAFMDPVGSMRLNDLVVNIDGLGTALAESFRENNMRMKQLIMRILEENLAGAYADFHEQHNNYEIANILWQLQNTKIMLSNNSLGLGIERILYHLNPSLPCQMKILQPHHVIDLETALKSLDNIAKTHLQKYSLIDKHLAAFLTAKMEMTKVLRVVELGSFPEFANDKRLIMLKLLAQAQQKIGNPPLCGLAIWAADMVQPVIAKLHRKTTRDTIRKAVRNVAQVGKIDQIAFVLFNAKTIGEDMREYENARILCNFHKEKVKYYTDPKKLRLLARENGRQISVTCAYIVLAVSVYLVAQSYIHL